MNTSLNNNNKLRSPNKKTAKLIQHTATLAPKDKISPLSDMLKLSPQINHAQTMNLSLSPVPSAQGSGSNELNSPAKP